MDPITIGLLGVVVFGIVGIFAAFIHQLLLSREKKLNDALQYRALDKETASLTTLRKEMLQAPRFELHYEMLGRNKQSIQELDQRIEEVFVKKLKVIHRYSEVILQESGKIIQSDDPEPRKVLCNALRLEMDKELEHYEQEMQQLQKHRAQLWDTNSGLQHQLVSQEQGRNKTLDTLYTHHTGVLEKVYLRHNHNSEAITQKTIESGNSLFKSLLTLPLQLLMGLFTLSTGIAAKKTRKETLSRIQIEEIESDINENESDQTLPEMTWPNDDITEKSY